MYNLYVYACHSVGKEYKLYRSTCLIAGKSSAKTGMQPFSNKWAAPDLPGAAIRAQVQKVGDGPRAQTAIPELANEPSPALVSNISVFLCLLFLSTRLKLLFFGFRFIEYQQMNV